MGAGVTLLGGAKCLEELGVDEEFLSTCLHFFQPVDINQLLQIYRRRLPLGHLHFDGLFWTAEQSHIDRERHRLAEMDAGEVWTLSIQQVVALCGEHRTGHAQNCGARAIEPGAADFLQSASCTEGSPLGRQGFDVNARFGQVHMRGNQHVVCA